MFPVKKFLLSLLGVGLGLSLLGVVLIAVGGFRPIRELEPYVSLRSHRSATVTSYDTPRTVSRQVDAAALKSVTLSLANADVQIETGSGSTATLRYDETYAGEWEYDFSGSALTLRSHRYGKSWLTDWLMNNLSDSAEGSDAVKVTLSLPAGCAPALSVNDVNGSCTADQTPLQSLQVQSVNTQIRLSGIAAADSIAVHATNGDARLTGCSAPSLNADAMVNAGCTVTGSDFGDIRASGQVNNTVVIEGLKNSGDYSLSYHTVNGSITYNGVSYSGNGVVSGGSAGSGKKSIDYQGVNSSLKVSFS